MRIVIAGYRDWALEIFRRVSEVDDANQVELADTPEKLHDKVASGAIEIVFLCGWSWIIADSILDRSTFFGLHPSNLPAYRGGSPIQHQILDGVIHSQLSIYKVTSELDAGPIVLKRPLSLDGHMFEIFRRLTLVGVTMIAKVIETYPNLTLTAQGANAPPARKRLTPSDSQMDKAELATLTCARLYNIIRAREDPYPNIRISDQTGTLILKLAEFESNSKEFLPILRDTDHQSDY
jgi:methionyl-tRNA formyltransferase